MGDIESDKIKSNFYFAWWCWW